MEHIRQKIQDLVKNLFDVNVDVELTRPDEQFGDYSTNLAMQIAKPLGKNPREIAEQITIEIKNNFREEIADATIAGPGFINIKLADSALIKQATREIGESLKGQSWIIEYSCPNAFKELHTGHLYNTIAGDVLARIIERAGATVHRTSFGGDVGLHVGKCLWGIFEKLGGEDPKELAKVSSDPLQRAAWLSECYVAGAKAYEDDESAKSRIVEINQAVYKVHEANDHDSDFARVYWECRQWSFDYFKAFYELIDVDDMYYYPESSTTQRGLEMVRNGLKRGLLEESEGAVVFRGDESKKLHTRVFITSKGLPTYETKDVGVILAEQKDYNFDYRVVLTGNDQAEYMKVVFAAMDALTPGIADKMTHLTNGTVRFGDGKKMSSRLGNVSRAVDVVAAVQNKVQEILNEDKELVTQITLGAIKYEFAKYRLGGDVAFDINESVSLQGNSGPYLQYAHARARSILAKVNAKDVLLDNLEVGERSLVRKIGEYTDVVDKAVTELSAHLICTYLYELAQVFNRFYENNRVVGDDREAIRVKLVSMYANRLKEGLGLLGIVAPDRM